MTSTTLEPARSSSPAPASSLDLDRLSAADQERLTHVLDRYLADLERGLPAPREALLVEHPDLAEMLTAYFHSLDELHDLAAGFTAGATDSLGSSVPGDVVGRIGDYDLVREIGRGGMGVVYEAHQRSLSRRVAVKLLPFAAVLDSRQIARFRHEAQAAARLHHPNIVPVFAIGVERGVHFYAMQLIDGRPLDHAIAELRGVWGRPSDRPIDPTKATSLLASAATPPAYYAAVVRLGIQAAEALHAAHALGIVHRDIKPSNLLLEAGGKLWVTDFGLARVAREASLTRTGDVVGTLKYMSPEQVAGRSAMVDHRTDVYSLGATLYELLCLRPAHRAAGGPELMRQIAGRDPVPLHQLRPDIPADLEQVVLKAMSRERDDRYSTAQQFAEDLRCVLEGKATQARPPTTLARLVHWEQCHRRVVALATLILVLLSVGLAIGSLLFAREQARAQASSIRADQHFRSAREVLDRFGVELSAKLATVPGTEHIRQELLQEASRYYGDFIRHAGGDPASRAELAEAYGRMATILDEISSDEEAVEAHGKAVEVFTALCNVNSADPQLQRQLALCKNNWGLALARLGHRTQAMQQIEAAIATQRLLSAHNREVILDLTTSLCNLGLIQRDLGQTASAQATFQEAITILEDGEELSEPKRGRQLAAALGNLGSTYLDTDPSQAQGLYSRAINVQLAATKQTPGDLGLERELGLSLNNLAAALSKCGSLDQAAQKYRQAIAIQEELARRMPAQLAYTNDLAVSCNNLGLVLCRSGMPLESMVQFRRALELYSSLVKHLPRNAAICSALGSVHSNIGLLEERSGELAGARCSFAEALEAQATALKLEPDSERFAALLQKHRLQADRLSRQIGMAETATAVRIGRD